VIFFEHISSEATKDFDHPILFIFENHVLPRIAGSSIGVVRGHWLCLELPLLCQIISNDKIQMTNQLQMLKCPNPQSSEQSVLK
jgi:hypothetical protein